MLSWRKLSALQNAADWNVVNVFICFFTLAELLETVTLIHKPVSLQPRGLINKGNWCYINAVSFPDAVPRPGHHGALHSGCIWLSTTSTGQLAWTVNEHGDWAIAWSACLVVSDSCEPHFSTLCTGLICWPVKDRMRLFFSCSHWRGRTAGSFALTSGNILLS